jgi:hypothetical protein
LALLFALRRSIFVIDVVSTSLEYVESVMVRNQGMGGRTKSERQWRSVEVKQKIGFAAHARVNYEKKAAS